jgi:hypothetical protein
MQPTAQAVGKQREEGTSPSGAKEKSDGSNAALILYI